MSTRSNCVRQAGRHKLRPQLRDIRIENQTRKPPPDARLTAASSPVGASGTQNGGCMSSLKMAERQILEQHFGMGEGYVLNFSDRTFGEFVREAVGREIHD